MGRLIYSAIASLDGYTADADGNFDWNAPDEEVHSYINDLVRPVGTFLYGRRMYEVMKYWETAEGATDPVARDFAEIWQAADKVVFSTTLDEVSTARTRLERTFDPSAVGDLTARSAHDVGIGGPHLGSQAILAGLVDEYQLFLSPILVGGGNPMVPPGVKSRLELVDERRFGNGVVHLRYVAS